MNTIKVGIALFYAAVALLAALLAASVIVDAWLAEDMARLRSLCDRGYINESHCNLRQARYDIPLIRKVPATKSRDCQIVEGEKMVCVHFVRGEIKYMEAK